MYAVIKTGGKQYRVSEGQTLKVSGGAWTCATDTRCDTSGTCSQVCIGTDCKTSWPIEAYDTGWIPRSNWKTVQLGSSTTKNANSNVAHNLNAPLAQLLIKVLVSSDGTDANSFEVTPSADAFYVSGNYHYGITIYQVDMNNIKLQTGINGISIVNDAPYTGYIIQLDTEDWYYKVKVWKLE